MNNNKSLLLKLALGLLLVLPSFFTHAVPTQYDLDDPVDFGKLCSGNHSVSNSPKEYVCEGKFSADNAAITLDGNSIIKAYSGYDISSSTIQPTSGYVELQSNNWSGDTVLQSTVLIGSISVPYTISIEDSTVDKYVENTTNHDVSISGSVIGEYVNAGTTITIDDSEVIGNVINRGNNDISILNDSEVGGYVDGGTTIIIDASNVSGNVSNRSNNDISVLNDSEIGGNVYGGTTITIDDSEVVGNVSNRSTNDMSILNDSEIGGYVDGGSTITISGSDVTGNVSNRSNNEVKIESDSEVNGNVVSQGKLSVKNSEIDGDIQSINHDIYLDESAEIHGDATAADNNWATIYFNDYDDDDRSVVRGTCLYRTDPENACGPTEPPVNQNPQFEFGTLTDSDCTISSPGPNNKQVVTCTLNFNNTYDTAKPKPLVFVMPTIDASLSVKNDGTTELPSTASVISTTWQTATIVQEIAPNAKKKTNNINYLDAPMSGQGNPQKSSNYIDYFVIEEGVISLNNGESQIVAGLVDTKTAASQVSSERNNADVIRYEDYGLDSFNSKPGILVQPQTKKNTSAWFTGMARNVGVESFSLALEKSEVTKNNPISSKEKVAFVAGEGSGFIQGARFFLGNGETRVTTTLNERVISPVEIGCEEYTSIASAGFDGPPILVANKNSRSGNNGGWIRRCDITKDKVYFIVEEDMDKDSERSHVAEDVGFFMFDRPNELGICEGFNNKSPVQTWLGSGGTLELNGSPQIVGALREDGERYVGFLDANTFDRTNSACEGQKCLGLDDLLINKEALEDVPDNLGNALNIPYVDKITSLPITVNGKKVYEYDSISIGTGGVVEIEAGKYKIGKLDINGTGELRVKSGDTVTIFTKDLSVNNGSFAGVPIVNWIGDKPVLAGDTHFRVNVLENGGKQVSLNSSGSNNKTTFVGLIYSEQRVDMSGTARVYGAVSASEINMSSSALVHAETSCIVPADDYEIEMSPATDLALMCGDDSPQFTITTSNNGVAESLSVTAAITPHPSYFDVSVVTGSGSYPNYSSNIDGELTLKITAKDTANIDFDESYKLTATLVDDVNQSVESLFKFVPFRFSLFEGDSPSNRLDVIAGQATSADTRVLACDSNNTVTVAKNYNIESEGEVGVSYQLNSPDKGIKGQLTYAPTYTNGVSDSPLTITESGIFDIQLSDTFDCDGFEGCPDNGTYDLEGFFSVYSRPWKIAICDVKEKATPTNLNPSTTTQAQGFMASGEEFSITYRPVAYAEVNVGADKCQLPITKNYALDSGPLAITRQVIYPGSNASAGDLVLSQVSPSFLPGDIGGVKVVDDNTWNEVGSFEVKTFEVKTFEDSNGNSISNPMYLGMTLDSDSQIIGRFYPKYFVLYDQVWVEPNSQSHIYMNQNFESVSFEVEALNSNKQAVINYANTDYSSSLRAKFNLMESGAYTSRFISPDFGEGSWTAKIGSIGQFSHAPSSSSICGDHTSLCWLKQSTSGSYEDGPFNLDGSTADDALTTPTEISIVEGVGNIDPVEFLDIGQKLTVQPDIRFGRIDLDDVGGNSGATIAIPLRTEYWNGNQFVVNEDDSTTNVVASTSASSIIWSGDDSTTTTATLDNGGVVSDGESRDLTASQGEDVSTREQVRLWQSMSTTPWLRYNWDSDEVSDDVNGEQDPSTVVTFGIYRGNDRVIYRGESGLTGQR